jgi:hypothetical protein
MNDENNKKYIWNTSLLIGISSIFYLSRYKRCRPNQYLITEDLKCNTSRYLKVSKSGFILPFQKYKIINIYPKIYNLNINYTYNENIQFKFPIELIIDPINPNDNINKFIKYSELVDYKNDKENLEFNNIDNTIYNIINHNIYTTYPKFYKNKFLQNSHKIKDNIISNISEDLNKFGFYLKTNISINNELNNNIMETNSIPFELNKEIIIPIADEFNIKSYNNNKFNSIRDEIIIKPDILYNINKKNILNEDYSYFFNIELNKSDHTKKLEQNIRKINKDNISNKNYYIFMISAILVNIALIVDKL